MARKIRVVDIAPLEGPPGPERAAAERALGEAAEDMGFLVIVGGPVERLTAPDRIAALTRIFSLPEYERWRLANAKHNAGNPNDYRGWYSYRRPLEGPLVLEGFDLGSGREPAPEMDAVERYLLQPNVWPEEALLPGWRALVEQHYRDLERLGHLVMGVLAAHLGLQRDYFEPFFGGGSSTFRFLRAPARPDLNARPEEGEERQRAVIDGRTVRLGTGAHRDSGVLTLLWQQGSLQAQDPDGDWLDAPKLPQALNVNFGDCMEFWTGGRLQATPHRVVAVDYDRFSIPFFFEPNVDAMIQPIPGAAPRPPIRYADHVLEKIKLFGTHSTKRLDKAA